MRLSAANDEATSSVHRKSRGSDGGYGSGGVVSSVSASVAANGRVQNAGVLDLTCCRGFGSMGDRLHAILPKRQQALCVA